MSNFKNVTIRFNNQQILNWFMKWLSVAIEQDFYTFLVDIGIELEEFDTQYAAHTAAIMVKEKSNKS